MGQQSKYHVLLNTLDVDALLELYHQLMEQWYIRTYDLPDNIANPMGLCENAEAWMRLAVMALASDSVEGEVMRDITYTVWEATEATPIETLLPAFEVE